MAAGGGGGGGGAEDDVDVAVAAPSVTPSASKYITALHDGGTCMQTFECGVLLAGTTWDNLGRPGTT